MTSEVVMAGTGASGFKAGKVFMFSVGRDVSRFAYKLIRPHQSCFAYTTEVVSPTRSKWICLH